MSSISYPLCLLVSVRNIISTGFYKTVFQDNANTWEYNLRFNNGIVTLEDLFFNGDHVLRRRDGGLGHILTIIEEETADADRATGEKKAKLKLKFSVPGSRLAMVAKRDATQHPFLTPLFDWAESVRLFRFGSGMNPETLALALKDIKIETDERVTSVLVPIFHKAKNELGESYIKTIIEDMRFLGYDLESIGIRRPHDLIVSMILPGELHGISVKERDIECQIDQTAISAGMYRALCLIGQVNYYAQAGKRGCFLVDDIGEGLDFERSSAIVQLLREKANRHGFQLIMATNDRFVMNKVPLSEWSVLQRQGNRVIVRNQQNSRKIFELFKMMGLNNFDFLRYDFINEDPDSVLDEIGAASLAD